MVVSEVPLLLTQASQL
ncbi:hypothetical protein Golob_021493 [Gossypium lobatum]|uniref:Uncharacterized protein n=1 Tax=Gossypium lobatum TaxID=34289 RepID=A0A7J8LDN6_9ROSI|nr:hypothetical protein [Gossypium lobatum]